MKCTISMMFGGWDNVLLRVGAAVLQCLEPELLSMDGQALLQVRGFACFQLSPGHACMFGVARGAAVLPAAVDAIAARVDDKAWGEAWKSDPHVVGEQLHKVVLIVSMAEMRHLVPVLAVQP